MYPHRIRLRGPWEATRTLSDGRVITERVNLAEHPSWEAASPLRLTRKFGMPRTLDPEERIWITCTGVCAAGELSLNGLNLGRLKPSDGYVEFEVTGRLSARNELRLDFPVVGPKQEHRPEIALEIRGPVFLEGLRLTKSSAGDYTISGLIAGATRDSLELYVLRHGRTVDYRVVSSRPTGCPFAISLPEEIEEGPVNLSFPAWLVELTEGATCWWRTDFSAESV